MKNTIVSGTLVACLVLSTSALADETEKPIASPEARKAAPRPPAHKPEWTNPSTGDPGRSSVADDLQKIVVLCAADHESAEFKRAWSAYVTRHRLEGAKLERTIQRVVDEAFRHRQSFGQSSGNSRLSPAWKSGASKSMHETSKAVIHNVKG